LEGDENFRIHVSDVIGGHVGQIVILRDPFKIVYGVDLISGNDFANPRLDIFNQRLGTLETSADRCTDMQFHQPDVDRGKKVGTDHEGKNGSDNEQQYEDAQGEHAMVQNEGQGASVDLAQTIESVFTPAVEPVDQGFRLMTQFVGLAMPFKENA